MDLAFSTPRFAENADGIFTKHSAMRRLVGPKSEPRHTAKPSPLQPPHAGRPGDAALPGGACMKNIGASVRARLSNLSRSEGVPLDFMIERFTIGRLLWRLSQSPEAHRFILKGAQLFSLWQDNPYRPTRDVDFLGCSDHTEESIDEYFTMLCSMSADSPDGL
jgi:Nucleotidyl transferase AbiEii toxin, Type IV TA system